MMNRRRTRSSPLDPDPVKQEDSQVEEQDPTTNCRLVTAAAGRFQLPDGWCVELVHRSLTSAQPHRVDKYFIEPHTGRRFRSILAVHRYLKSGQVDTQATADNEAVVDKQATMQITRHTSKCSPDFVLPDGWKIEEKPRMNTRSSHSDRYYIEPGSGKRFRSLVAVERYLTEENDHTPPQALIHTKKLMLSSGSSSQNKKIRPLVLKNSSHSNACDSTLNGSRQNTYSSLSSGSGGQKKMIRPLKVVSKNSSHSNACDSALNASRRNTYSSLSIGSSGQKKKIRSLKVVSKNLSHSNACNSTLNALRRNTYSSTAEHVPPKKQFPSENSRPSQLIISSQPPKVKWVLVGRGGDEFHPFMDDSMVAEPVTHRWSEIFKSTIYGEIAKAPFF
ncbi:methyl-CpG-binding domain-containing protein 7-like isoform X1 [Argentina anserina]|uniref:methyl-CpG-binding domain-containing protein 7-like isoform X1 n=1 Tax=Argentina anserina TaxID=57926 RepID=UPI0021763F17|nr:methyl-CpG-binding domain-containing protein 7-like isoform X1 [Potentilla anserina]